MALAVALAAAVLLYCARRRVLRAIAAFLVVDDAGGGCDAIVVMNGNISTRSYRALDLYAHSRAPVLMARLADTEEVRLGVIPNITDATRRLLVMRGVPASDIHVLTSQRWVAGTWAEAIILCAALRERGCRRVSIVTDAFHTRRARFAFRGVMGDDNVVFQCAATRYSLGLMDRWWRSEYGLVQVVVEYIKFVHYLRLRRRARRRRPSESDLPAAASGRRLVSGEDGRGAPARRAPGSDSAGRR